jgi:hypothetical protein
VKALKIFEVVAGSIPIPVSRTSKRSRSESPSCPATATTTATSPRSVNLTALPTRLIRT